MEHVFQKMVGVTYFFYEAEEIITYFVSTQLTNSDGRNGGHFNCQSNTFGVRAEVCFVVAWTRQWKSMKQITRHLSV
jgi:hypothetical protein